MKKPPNLSTQGFNKSMLKKVQRTKEANFQLWVWVLFIASACCFTASSLRSGDILSLLGSLFFLGACIISVTPLVLPGSQSSQKK
jgi:hypothetical protein